MAPPAHSKYTVIQIPTQPVTQIFPTGGVATRRARAPPSHARDRDRARAAGATRSAASARVPARDRDIITRSRGSTVARTRAPAHAHAPPRDDTVTVITVRTTETWNTTGSPCNLRPSLTSALLPTYHPRARRRTLTHRKWTTHQHSLQKKKVSPSALPGPPTLIFLTR